MDVTAASGAIGRIRELMVQNRDRLIKIDSVIGDGDLGLTMVSAFTAAAEIDAGAADDVGTYFAKAGMAMAKAAPSTMGTLMATGFMRGGKAIKGRDRCGPADLASFFRAFADGVMERGKSKPGEKTVVDLLDPVARTAEEAVESGADMAAFAAALRMAATDSLILVSAMTSQHGKAAIYREQTIGKPDPGAEAGALVVMGIADSI